MSLELEQHTLKEQFEAVIQTEDKLQIRDFLNHQNISDQFHGCLICSKNKNFLYSAKCD